MLLCNVLVNGVTGHGGGAVRDRGDTWGYRVRGLDTWGYRVGGLDTWGYRVRRTGELTAACRKPLREFRPRDTGGYRGRVRAAG